MNRIFKLLLVVAALGCSAAYAQHATRPIDLVRPMTGTADPGNVTPIATAPFGMVGLGPDTFYWGSGYKHYHGHIKGFSHTHKSGQGGTDFMDIMFMPLSEPDWLAGEGCPSEFSAPYSHDQMDVKPGYHRVKLLDSNIDVELTATPRCGMHRYTYPEGRNRQIFLDMKHGGKGSCTIIPADDWDTVRTSKIEMVNDRTIRGYRISNGWVPEMHVYFYAEFSEPIKDIKLYDHCRLQKDITSLEGDDVRAVLDFGSGAEAVVARVGISPTSMEGARRNLKAEIKTWKFDKVVAATQELWNKTLSAVEIADADTPQKEMFYTSLYFAHMYPQLYSDVTGEYRSSDIKVHKGNFNYYGGCFSPWDTFRTQIPLITILHPEVMNDLVKTLQAHYDNCGMLPVWLLAGQENMCMIGYNSVPTIADIYSKGIRDYDVEAIYEAMKVSANKDTFGYFLRQFRGARYYNQYGYVPCDLEVSSVSKTLEYSYADWSLAQMAKALGKKDDYDIYMERANRYKNLFDKDVNFMRGKDSKGQWRTPFDPFYSNHYQPDDDFCEGTSWSWTFFVPHDPAGLADLMGGEEAFVEKLDSLFAVSSHVTGPNPASDITGRVGQYAHGNEPAHQILYMYNYVGQPWRSHKRISDILYTMYRPTPDGICGNDDSGQMSAWYVMSAMGIFPQMHGNGVYCVGTPMFQDLKMHHPKGTLTILAPEASRENCYVQSLKVNGEPYTKSWFTHEQLFGGDVVLEFEMGAEPNKAWGAAPEDRPRSMRDEKWEE